MYPNLTPTLVTLLGIALAAAGFIAVRRPFLRRLALRQIARRRGEAVLVVVGSVLGTAIIIGTLIVGDTLNFSVRQTAYKNLGPIDEIVSSPTVAQGDQATRRIARLRGDPAVDGLLHLRGDQAAGTRARGGEVDFAQAAACSGGVKGGSGLSGPAPGAGEAVINDDLATQLGARAGDTLTVYLYGRPTQVRVARVVPTVGLAGAGTGQTAARNAFFAAGTLVQAATEAKAAAPARGGPAPADGADNATAPGAAAPPAQPRTFTFVSNTGGVAAGEPRSDARAAKLNAAPGPLAGRGTWVETPKQSVLEAAEQAGNGLGSLFLFIGSFSVIAGGLLPVNIFVMLAEERKSELGMRRAVGMKRGRLVRSFIIEGTVYA